MSSDPPLSGGWIRTGHWAWLGPHGHLFFCLLSLSGSLGWESDIQLHLGFEGRRRSPQGDQIKLSVTSSSTWASGLLCGGINHGMTYLLWIAPLAAHADVPELAWWQVFVSYLSLVLCLLLDSALDWLAVSISLWTDPSTLVVLSFS